MEIKYIFKSGRKIRLASSKKFPKEFFYGYFHLRKKGFKVDLIEESDLGINKKNNLIFKILDRFLSSLIGLSINHLLSLIKKNNINLLNKTDILLVTTSSMGLTLGVLKSLRILKKPVLFFVMGLLPYKKNSFRNIFYKFLLKDIHLVCISNHEKKYLEKNFRKENLSYIPFGVDNEFWNPIQEKEYDKKYVLAIGNDYARDWQTLIDSWDFNFPTLKLITTLPISTNKKNIEIIKGSWGGEFLTDLDIKKLYLNSLYVIIPLKETIQPSGQSCCLQAMACGKPVIMSNIKGIWDKNLLINNENILLVEPNSVTALKIAIKEMNRNKILYNKIKLSSRKLVEHKFNNNIMSMHIESKIREIIGESI